MAGSESPVAAVVRLRRLIALAWVAAAGALAPLATRLEGRLDVAVRVDGSESEQVERVLADRFHSPFARHAVLVITGAPTPADTAGRAVLRAIVAAVGSMPGVTRTFSYLDGGDSLFLGHGGGTFVIAGMPAEAGPSDARIGALREATGGLGRRLRAEHPAIALRWTGELALNRDLRAASARDVTAAERRALPLTVALLAVAFGALIAALLPAAAGVLSIVIALGAAAVVARWAPLSIVLENVVSMLGLGLGIDYALLMVSRFREGLAAGLPPDHAASLAARRAGRTVVVSGATVAVGFAALLLIPLSELRSVGVGGLLVVTASVLVATTLLPGVLAALGARIELGRLGPPRTGSLGTETWRRWARMVTRRPVTTLVLAGAPLLALALQAMRLDTGLPRGDWLPPRMESAQAVHSLQAMRRAGMVQTLRVVIELPAGIRALDARGWEAIRHAAQRLEADPRVARVRALPMLVPVARPSPLLLSLLPPGMLATFVSEDGRATLLEIIPREGIDPREVGSMVRALRHADAGALTALPGAHLSVGGLPALNVDYEDAVGARTSAVVALVIGGTLLALFVAFRSVLVPLKAVALNLLSVAAAFGAVVLVFQDGRGHGLLGLAAPVDGVFPSVPILVFCIVFGLSMDYEVFLIGRVAEARRTGSNEEDALAEGVARTGGVITSAAAIMVAVFAAFTLGDFLLVKLLGFALAVSVLLDATVVRLALGPALLRLAGRWNWWPGDRWPTRRCAAVTPRAAVLPVRPAAGD